MSIFGCGQNSFFIYISKYAKSIYINKTNAYKNSKKLFSRGMEIGAYVK